MNPQIKKWVVRFGLLVIAVTIAAGAVVTIRESDIPAWVTWGLVVGVVIAVVPEFLWRKNNDDVTKS